MPNTDTKFANSGKLCAESLKCLFLASTTCTKIYFLITSLVPIARPCIFGQRSTPAYFIRNSIQNQKISLFDYMPLSKSIMISKIASAVANGGLASDTYKYNKWTLHNHMAKTSSFVFQTRNLLHFTSTRCKSEQFCFMIYLWAMPSILQHFMSRLCRRVHRSFQLNNFDVIKL